MNGIKSPQNNFSGHSAGKRNWGAKDRGPNGREHFKKRPNSAHKKKGNKSKNKVDVLKNKEEYSHLVNSTKLTVFDWDSTIMLRNLPAQLDAVKRLVQKTLKDISIKKFCPVKRTFKSRAFVTLACVLDKKVHVEDALLKLSNLKVDDYSIIVSRFIKPHSFVSNAFSACIVNLSDDATEKDLSMILNDCGVINALDVEYSENGAVKKVLVNMTNNSDLATLLDKNGMQLKSGHIDVVPIKAASSVIVGNVHPKMSNLQIGKIFGENVLLVQKISNMIFQIFFKDEEEAVNALRKDGESVKDLQISVQPWSKKNLKQHKVFISVAENQDSERSKFNINEFLGNCTKLCSITPVKKNKIFMATFESKEGQKEALELNGTVFNGWTVAVTKKRPLAKKAESKSDDHQFTTETTNSNSKKSNHVFFE